MATGKTLVPPQPCQLCGVKMHYPNELKEETFTGVCDVCTGAEPAVIGAELLDGARLWAYPPLPGSGTRQRRILIGYPGCDGCKGKGCQPCVDRRNGHPIRKWVAVREARITSATQSVYNSHLKKEGLYDLAMANAAPKNRLRKVLIPLLKRVEKIKDRWSRIVKSRLRFVNI